MMFAMRSAREVEHGHNTMRKTLLLAAVLLALAPTFASMITINYTGKVLASITLPMILAMM
jgi:hypothetical protein